MRVFQTFNRNEAQLVAHITAEKGKADLCVYIVGSRALAYGENRWFISNSRADSDKAIYFGTVGSAAIIIHFVKNLGNAGWQKDHPLKGRL